MTINGTECQLKRNTTTSVPQSKYIISCRTIFVNATRTNGTLVVDYSTEKYPEGTQTRFLLSPANDDDNNREGSWYLLGTVTANGTAQFFDQKTCSALEKRFDGRVKCVDAKNSNKRESGFYTTEKAASREIVEPSSGKNGFDNSSSSTLLSDEVSGTEKSIFPVAILAIIVFLCLVLIAHVIFNKYRQTSYATIWSSLFMNEHFFQYICPYFLHSLI